MTGKNVKADLLWHLKDAGDDPERLHAALKSCVVLTAEEAALISDFLKLKAGILRFEEVDPMFGGAHALALLTPESGE